MPIMVNYDVVINAGNNNNDVDGNDDANNNDGEHN